MVSIVLVSHSSLLAAGIVEMARMVMQQAPVAIAVAAGADDPGHPLGTDAAKIRQAIEEVYSDDGVLVLMDLGSAVLSAEMAVDFLPEHKRANVRLCAAPIVEGTIAAVVQASLGASLDRVAAEALEALAGKVESLSDQGQASGAAAPSPSTDATAEVLHAQLTVTNRLGLHARPAALLVQTAGRFCADVRLARVGQETRQVNAKSFNAVASLGIRQHEVITVSARGPDAAEALAALQQLAADQFGEADELLEAQPSAPPSPMAEALTGALRGAAASPGYAIGPAVVLRQVEPQIERRIISDPDTEMSRLQAVLDAVRESTRVLRDQIARQHPYEAAIFDAYLMFLTDPDILARVRQIIARDRVCAEWAWREVVNESARAFESIEDEYMRARAVDIRDIGRQVLSRLTGQTRSFSLDRSGIVIASDLSPSDTAHLDRSMVLGICTERGSPTSHSAILARTLGIPAVVGVGAAITQVAPGTPLVIDGYEGLVWIAPDESIVVAYTNREAQWRATQEQARQSSAAPAVTKDGVHIEIAANIGSLADARVAVENGADGVGLLRTEFLFLDRTAAPDENEQYEVYTAIARVMGERPVVVRTLDVGGDKPLAYISLEREDNPFLGQRAIRLCLNQPDLFATQLRAILRASAGHRLKVMFPMIADIGELRRARAVLESVLAGLHTQSVPVADAVEVGIMVEVPSAALLAHVFAPEVDFFSIGSNDLVQYTLAAERGNAAVAHLQDGLHPAVLMQIQRVVQSAQQAGKWVSVCGELAADHDAVPVLIGLGVQKLSMAPGTIPHIKALIRRLTLQEARQWASQALAMESAETVRRFIRSRLEALVGE
ncbi:phosphoenolpyruvate--protein phosphotransferase [Roseiflexus sp.]|uniref:phosphoenolpyruvate--protein phosphotransferase n=1 Tax=Roseiflexus sp. TaxID=2562120 RepID=UPI0021DBF93D|nr:phosphoenolpyruvate--protein phosphotransferase [Roseiflexus sp.]GIW01049.1 MAG: multiphosphoryl transfer protein [Roseiflexus sp.]